MKKHIALIIAVLGFVLALGTAGASDADLIGMEEIFTRLLIALFMIVGGSVASYIFEQKEWEE